MRRTIYTEGQLDLATVSERAILNCERLDFVTIQADTIGATAWSTAVATVKVSNNGDKWYAVPAGAVTRTAEGITAAIDVFGFRFVCLETTTAQSGVSAKVSFYGEGISEDEKPAFSYTAGKNIGNTAGIPGGGGGGIGGAEGAGGGGSSL